VKVIALATAISLLLGSLHGTVMRGPTMPVCKIGTPCTAPAKHITLFFTRNGSTRSTMTDERGRYRVRLAAGVYSVRTNQRPFGTVPQPSRVRVRGGIDARVNFAIDTGIR
jgi:hypothetical protein